MRKGTALLKQMMAAACTFCLFAWCAESVAAADLEETDSGAPSAVVMFPVTGKSEPVAGAMKPVVFNHLVHEKAVENCESCHHTGDPESCSDCHTLTGSPEGSNITLSRAMHAPRVAPRDGGKNTPSSCVSCHLQRISSKQECRGCHSLVPGHSKNSCAVCHNAEATPEQLAKGTSGTLFADENLAMAAKAVEARAKQPELGFFTPTKAVIGSLANEYQPCLFNHRRHVAGLADRIKDDKLAHAFHSSPEVLCTTCHHHSPASMNPPKCSSCHDARINPANPGRPALKAAYHLQCMGCHSGMNIARPERTNCTACHKAAEDK